MGLFVLYVEKTFFTVLLCEATVFFLKIVFDFVFIGHAQIGIWLSHPASALNSPSRLFGAVLAIAISLCCVHSSPTFGVILGGGRATSALVASHPFACVCLNAAARTIVPG